MLFLRLDMRLWLRVFFLSCTMATILDWHASVQLKVWTLPPAFFFSSPISSSAPSSRSRRLLNQPPTARVAKYQILQNDNRLSIKKITAVVFCSMLRALNRPAAHQPNRHCPLVPHCFSNRSNMKKSAVTISSAKWLII